MPQSGRIAEFLIPGPLRPSAPLNVRRLVLGWLCGAAILGSCHLGRAVVTDFYTPADVRAVRLEGWLGRYVNALPEVFLLRSNLPAPYLEAVEKRGDKSWRAEHIGKWLETACATWQYDAREDLKKQIDLAVKRLVSAQQPDGWLGSYDEPLRFHQVDWNGLEDPSSVNEATPGWDLWCNLMSLEGLLKYNQTFPANGIALESATRIGDLVAKTFGPGRQDITLVPHDKGIGAMTWLLGAIQLYQKTGNPSYLEFCRYIIAQFGRPETMPLLLEGKCGPAEASFPFSEQGAPVKHAEFELILRGLCELYRVTGDPIYLETCRNAYDGGYAPLVPTMCLSGYLPSRLDQRVPRTVRERVEMCDIPPLLRWWVEMFRLTGEARFMEALEREIYNQLLAQRTVGGLTCAYLNARHFESPSGVVRKYNELDSFHCCFSTGGLGISDLPGWIYFRSTNGLLINLFEQSSFRGEISGVPVGVSMKTEYPLDERIEIRVDPRQPVTFALQLRIPQWCSEPSIRINSKRSKVKAAPGSICSLSREWRPGDRIELRLPMPPRVSFPVATAPEFFTIERGPLVLAMSERFNREGDGWCYASPVLDRHGGVHLEKTTLRDPAGQAKVGWTLRVRARTDVNGRMVPHERTATLVPFSDAGLQREPYVAAFPIRPALEQLPPQLGPEFSEAHLRLASAAADSGLPEHDAERAIDGDPESSWEPEPGSGASWIEVRLPARKRVSRAVIRFGDRSAHPVDFELTSWAGADRVADIPVKHCKLGDYYWTRLSGTAVDRLRLTISKMSGDEGEGSVSEIELFED